MHTHLEQWATDTEAPGEQLGVRCLAQRSHLSRGNSCRSRDSNPQPRVTSPMLFPLGHSRLPLEPKTHHCNGCIHMYKSLVFGDEFLAQGLHFKSHQKCSAGIRTCLSADQSSSSTLTQSVFSFLTLPYTQIHCHVRIEKSPVQTVAIKLEAHNSLEYHYMLKH